MTNAKDFTAEEMQKNLPPSFTRKVSDEQITELAIKIIEGYSYNDFVNNFGEWFSISCELLAYRDKEKKRGNFMDRLSIILTPEEKAVLGRDNNK